MNRENLKLLADYLIQLPAGYEHFDMFNFHSFSSRPYTANEVSINTCGTVACAVGHAPYVDGLPEPEFGERWHEYSDRLFNLTPLGWAWCFSDRWKYIDNTPHGAAKRIYWMLEHGVPDDVEEVLDNQYLPDYIAEQLCQNSNS